MRFAVSCENYAGNYIRVKPFAYISSVALCFRSEFFILR